MPPASAATVKRTKTDLKSDRMMSSNTKNTLYCDMCTRTCTKCNSHDALYLPTLVISRCGDDIVQCTEP